MIRKLSTLSGVDAIRWTAVAGEEIDNADIFEMSLNGLAGNYPFNSDGWASAKVTFQQLTDNLSGSLEDARDLRVITLSATGTGLIEGDTRIVVGQIDAHEINLVAGDGMEISGNAAGSRIVINASVYS